jgi:phosphopentomutase
MGRRAAGRRDVIGGGLHADGNRMRRFRRIILIVMDSVGIGELPDAAQWGDAGSDTLGHVLAAERPSLPHFRRLGLGNIRRLPHCPPVKHPEGCYGKAATLSQGKDTTVGHWEMAGLYTSAPFPTYPRGFPARIIEPFQEAIGRGVLGNKTASGTEIIQELGEEHLRSGKPIVYTSADSVFQVAAHENVIPVEELYRICRIARELLDGPDRVARVIARPFVGPAGNFTRTGNRKDFAIPPPQGTLLDRLLAKGLATVAVGKISSIFDGRGISESLEAHGNDEAVDQTLGATARVPEGLIFANLVDFDMLWGHRNDPPGYARCLERFDQRLPELRGALREGDCLMISADHGCDPTTPSTDHSREYVPILVSAPMLRGSIDLGTRGSLADIGQTIAENFELRLPLGTSFLHELR